MKKKKIIKSIVNPTNGLVVDDEMDFQDIKFSLDTTDNTYKLAPKVQKQLDEMVLDAVQPKIEQDIYNDDELDSFMFVDEQSKNEEVIDVKPSKIEISDNKIQISPPEDYNDIKKLLNTTVIEISSDSEDDEVTYIKTTPSHPRDRLRRKLNKKDEGEVVRLINENDDVDFRRVTPSHP